MIWEASNVVNNRHLIYPELLKTELLKTELLKTELLKTELPSFLYKYFLTLT